MAEIVIMKQNDVASGDEIGPEVFPSRDAEDAMRLTAFLGKDHRTTENKETKQISSIMGRIMSDSDQASRFAQFMSLYNQRSKEKNADDDEDPTQRDLVVQDCSAIDTEMSQTQEV